MVEHLSIKNLKTGIVKQFDMSEADYLIYEGSVDWGSIQVDHSTFQFPRQIGSYVSNTVMGTRDVAINGWIIGNSKQEIESKKMALSVFINPMDEFQITVGDYYIDGVPTSNVTFGREYGENNSVAVKFLIQFNCPYPLFLLDNAIVVDVAKDVGMFHFPLIIPQSEGIIMGYRKQSIFTQVSNVGAIDVGMVITLTANDIVDNPQIINVNTKEFIKINKVMEPGEQIVIDTNVGNRSIIGTKNKNSMNYLKYMDFDSTWLQVPAGLSLFAYKTYEDDGSEDETYKNLDVSIKYKTALFNLGDE